MSCGPVLCAGYQWNSTKAQGPRASEGLETKEGSVKLAPPQVLLQYMPLGYITNAFLTAFNEIRS